MNSLRLQMQQLADKISQSRKERKACISRCTKSREQLRTQVEQQRDKTKAELAKTARTLEKELTDFRHRNQKSVAGLLRENRSRRTSRARSLHSLLRQEVANCQRYVATQLRNHRSERMRVQRQQERTARQTIQAVKQQVRRLSSATRRMTQAWGQDRLEARRIWARIAGAAVPPMRSTRPETPGREAAAVVATIRPVSTVTAATAGLALPPIPTR